MRTDKTFPASFYIPEHDSWAAVQGAVTEEIDGKFYLRLVCKLENDPNKTLLLNTDTVQVLFERYPVPF